MSTFSAYIACAHCGLQQVTLSTGIHVCMPAVAEMMKHEFALSQATMMFGECKQPSAESWANRNRYWKWVQNPDARV